MKKNGFTLVELICVIILLGVLMTLAVPAAMKLSSQVKGKSYNVKIDLIEQSANNYGSTNQTIVKRGISLRDPNRSYICKMTYEKDEIVAINYSYVSGGYDPAKILADNEFWCTKILVEDLAESGNLDYDEEDKCVTCSTAELEAYDDIIINPVTNYVINKCQIYMYYKHNRVYSVFDKANCDLQADTPQEGREYKPIKY